MCDSYPVPVALSRPASQALFGPREMLAVAGAGGAKYLRRAGTCPSCLARYDASVMPLQPPPLGTRLRASWKLWAGGGGTVKVVVVVVFSLSLSLSLLRLFAPPSRLYHKLQVLTINYVLHSMRLLYCKSPAQLFAPPRLRYRGEVRRSVCRARVIGRHSPEKLSAWLQRHGDA